jgi:competence protein ComEA
MENLVMNSGRPAPDAPSVSEAAPGNWLKRSDQWAVATVVGGCLLIMAAYWLDWTGRRGRLLDIERASPRTTDFRVDLNRAEWPELTLLPGISETLARRIVASRNEQGLFREPAELMRVAGIGPKSLQRIAPYLLPLADSGGPGDGGVSEADE